MTLSFLDTMREGLTPVYQRGLERMTLNFGATANDGTTAIVPYDFQSYSKLYGGLQPDSPRYLLVPNTPTGEDALTVRVWYKLDGNQAQTPVDVSVPAGWPAGRPIAVEIPGNAAEITNALLLTQFQPQLPASRQAADWTIVALLGNLAKLLWVVGWEHQEIGFHLGDIAAQRSAGAAHGASLDHLGQDLGVPRFPPTPYTWDPDTLALYHLDDLPVPPQPEVAVIADDRARYQATSHPGQNNGAHSGRAGRFGRAFEFQEPATNISVADHAEFALPVNSSFTVEAVVKPDRTTTATGPIIAKRAQLNTAADAGWALTIGSFRGVDGNVRFSISDGVKEVELFADIGLTDGLFHHVAGVIEHRAGPPAMTFARLYLEGVQVASLQVDPLGALSNNQSILIGSGQESVNNAPSPVHYRGLVDEVRISRIARPNFNPVVGEADDQYRRRLRIFQRWLLPTPDAIQGALNEIAGPVANDPNPFIVDELVDPMVIASRVIPVLPDTLMPGQCIAADGQMRLSEAQAVGFAADDDFDPAWLTRHPDQPNLSFAGNDANRMMQWVVRDGVDSLLARLVGQPGTLTVEHAYDPAGGDLQSIGRSLILSHTNILPPALAVHAHAAGFGWVCLDGSGKVHVSQPAGLALRVTPLVNPSLLFSLPDVGEGVDLQLGLDPDLGGFPDVEVSWSLTQCGHASAVLTSDRPPKLHANTPGAGQIYVNVEVRGGQHVARGSRLVRIGLADNSLIDSIAQDGTRGVNEIQAAGDLTSDFSDLYLSARSDAANVDFGADLNNRRMQFVTGRLLDRLIANLVPIPGILSILKAYDPAAAGLASQGRALVLRHSTLTASQLGAHAFAVGFDYVRIDPNQPGAIQVASQAGDQAEIFSVSEVKVKGIPGWMIALPSLNVPQVCFSADGSRAFLTGQRATRVTSFTLTGAATTLPQLALDHSQFVGPNLMAIAFANGQLFVARQSPDAISVLDPVTLATTSTFQTGPQPNVMASDGNRLFVGCSGDVTLRSYDAQTKVQLKSLVLPAAAMSIAPIPGGASLYVVLAGNQFCQVDRANLTIMGAVVNIGNFSASAVVTPDGTKLYVGCVGDVRVYTTNNNQLSKTIPIPNASLVFVSVSSDGAYVYVANSSVTLAPVRVIDVAQGALLAPQVTPGGGANWVATSPAAAVYSRCFLAASEGSASLTLGDPSPLPAKAPHIVAGISVGSGAGEHIAWSAVPLSRGRVSLQSLTNAWNWMKGLAPGKILLRLTYVRGNHLLPYQFAVALNQTLDPQPNVTIRKDQYDLVMNVLNWYHPLGVEVRTERLRSHVVELTELGDLFPGYTFPIFHNPGLPLPAAGNP